MLLNFLVNTIIRIIVKMYVICQTIFFFTSFTFNSKIKFNAIDISMSIATRACCMCKKAIFSLSGFIRNSIIKINRAYVYIELNGQRHRDDSIEINNNILFNLIDCMKSKPIFGVSQNCFNKK